MPRDYSRSASPVSHPTKDRNYRDRSDARPKRKDRDGADDAARARKKIQMPRKETNYPSVNELKKRIRDVKRLLNKVDLPADARIVQERALAGYEKDLEDENNRRDRSKMIKKYHFVRFLDRKTATKDVNRLLRREKALSESSDPATSKKTKLAQKIHIARVNLNYTIYYPLTEKYVALYAKVKKEKESATADSSSKDDAAEDSGDDAGFKAIHASAADKPALWHTVEKCMKDGTLDLLRDGKLSSASPSREEGSGQQQQQQKSSSSSRQSEKNKNTAKSNNNKKTDSKKDKTPKTSNRGAAANKKTERASSKVVVHENNDDDDDASDGGFFEM
ncbi:Efg1 domain-containing protein [Aspergillus melleus]|uniref:Efg1 domain-containing protein n=1 Tax=Aspergillus melleus TaxID=138277 RepID=UPI001E8D33CE|nr:rRNA-processing protein efg1 [Aspergillus melleus]KAH8423273.1 rRNA-processing protein efg1 [Aspergillus melleus]